MNPQPDSVSVHPSWALDERQRAMPNGANARHNARTRKNLSKNRSRKSNTVLRQCRF